MGVTRAMHSLVTGLLDRLGINVSHPSNRFWAATSISLAGWVVTARIRRKGERQTYRRWFKIDVFNYNYSDEARRASREKNAILDRRAFPKDGREECCSCGQTIPHGQEKLLVQPDGGTDQREDPERDSDE